MACSIGFCPSTSCCEICVKDVILAGMVRLGSINICFRSMTSRCFILTAPNSMISSKRLERPVVSKSNTTKVASSNLRWSLLKMILYSGSTMLSSQPYNILKLRSGSCLFKAVTLCWAIGKACTTWWSQIPIASMPQSYAVWIYSSMEHTPSISEKLECTCHSVRFSLALSFRLAGCISSKLWIIKESHLEKLS